MYNLKKIIEMEEGDDIVNLEDGDSAVMDDGASLSLSLSEVWNMSLLLMMFGTFIFCLF